MPLNLGRFALLSLMAWLLCCFIISPAGSTHPVHRAQEPTSNVDPVLKVQGDAADKEAFALYLNGDHQGALRRLADALALYRRARDRAGEANVLNGMGVIYASLNDFKKALKLYTEALSASEAAGNSAHGALVATLSSLGALYESLGEYQKGLEVLQRGLGIATKNGDRKGEGAVRHHLGIIHVRQGDYKQAVYHVEIALKIRRDEEQGDDFDVIATLNNLGLAYATTGRTQEGLARLGEALNMAHVAGAPKDGVKVYNSIGRVRTGTGEYREAVKAYESARSVNARFVRDIRSEFESLQGLGLAYLSQQKLNDALNYYQQATVVASKTGNPFDEGTAFQRLGFVYERLTQFDKALQHYTRALRLHERLGQRAGEGETLISIGGIHRQRGQFAEALSYYDRALAIATGLNDLDSKRIILNDTGEVYRSQGMYARALEFHQNSLRMSRETGNRIGEERSLGNIGGVYQSMGQPNTALGYYRQSLDIARSIGNRADEATNLNNIGNIALIYSSLDAAHESYTRALEIARASGDRSSEGVMLHNLAFVEHRRGQYQPAIQKYRQALTIQREMGNRPVEAETLNNLAETLLKLEKYEEALENYQQALALRRAVGDLAGEGKTLSNIGILYETQGDQKQALRFYRQAIDAWESVRAFASIEEFKTSVADQFNDVYQRSVSQSMRLGQPREAFDLSERARARSFLDQLGNGRLNLREGADATASRQAQEVLRRLRAVQRTLAEESGKRYEQETGGMTSDLRKQAAALEAEYQKVLAEIKVSNPQYTSLVSVSPLSLPSVQQRLADMQQTLGKEVTLLSYFITPGGVLAFLVTPDSFIAKEVCGAECVGTDGLGASITAFRDFTDTEEAYPHSLQRLYAWLVKPIESHLKLEQQVIVVPHGILHYLPFSALTDGRQYLTDRYTISYLPSASVLQYARWQGRPPVDSALVMAQSRAANLPFLRFADQAANDIARLYDKTEALVSGAATEAALRNRASRSNIIFLAAHSQLNTHNPLFSRIFLAPGDDQQEGKNDGLLEMHEVYDLDLGKVELVVLSACQTQLGARSRGDDIVGLNRAFVYAGAASIVASLWSVREKQTGELMYAFFRHLRDGMGKAEALRRAQREIREKYPHPYYWSAFVLSGDPGAGTTTGKSYNKER